LPTAFLLCVRVYLAWPVQVVRRGWSPRDTVRCSNLPLALLSSESPALSSESSCLDARLGEGDSDAGNSDSDVLGGCLPQVCGRYRFGRCRRPWPPSRCASAPPRLFVVAIDGPSSALASSSLLEVQLPPRVYSGTDADRRLFRRWCASCMKDTRLMRKNARFRWSWEHGLVRSGILLGRILRP
jgi:hypothetical protein